MNPQLQTVTALSGFTSDAKSITATCPAGKRVVGAAGGVIPGPASQETVDAIRPDAGLTSVTVRVREDETGVSFNWAVEAIAMCATAPVGLQLVTATSAADSSNKSVTATCPTGKQVLGTGSEVTGPPGEVLVDGVLPDAALANVTVNALEDETGTAGTWSVTAYAICANAMAGLERKAVTSSTDSSSSRSAQAQCSPGKGLTGVAGTINSPNGQILLNSFFFDNTQTSAGIDAAEDVTGDTANWSVTAYAICAPIVELVVGTGSPGSTSGRGFGTDCPTGQRLAGTGADLANAFGEAMLNYVGPNVQNANPLSDAFAFAWEDVTGTDRNWTIRSFAICSTPMPGLELVTAISPVTTSSVQSVTATCPAGKRVLSAGFNQETGPGGTIVMQGFPNAALTSVTAAGVVIDGTPTSFSVAAYALCATAPPGLLLVSKASPFESEEFASSVATCPANKYVTGTGSELREPNGTFAPVVLDDVRPNADLSTVTASGIEPENGTAANWNVKAYAICAAR